MNKMTRKVIQTRASCVAAAMFAAAASSRFFLNLANSECARNLDTSSVTGKNHGSHPATKSLEEASLGILQRRKEYNTCMLSGKAGFGMSDRFFSAHRLVKSNVVHSRFPQRACCDEGRMKRSRKSLDVDRFGGSAVRFK